MGFVATIVVDVKPSIANCFERDLSLAKFPMPFASLNVR
jgi:hypothetical protein